MSNVSRNFENYKLMIVLNQSDNRLDRFVYTFSLTFPIW